MDKKEACPHCGRNTVIPIVYGMPAPEAVEEAQRGEVALAGCIVSETDPAKSCSNCGSTWSDSQDKTSSAISEKFADYFATWDIHLPPGSEAAMDRGSINKAGWRIRYLFGNEDERFIEFYATHRMTNDRRHRIYESGKTESLDAIQEMYMYDPEARGSEQEARNRYLQHNKRIADELRRVDIYPEGDINSFLRTNDVPHRKPE